MLFVALTMGAFSIPDGGAAQQQTTADSLHGMSIEEAVQKAKADYPRVRSARLEIESREALKKTAWDLGTTRVFTGKEEVGNGAPGIQTLLGVEQHGIAPFSIAPERILRKEQIGLAESTLDMTLLEIEREVRMDCNNAYVTKRQYILYQELHSVSSEFEKAASLRYEQDA